MSVHASESAGKMPASESSMAARQTQRVPSWYFSVFIAVKQGGSSRSKGAGVTYSDNHRSSGQRTPWSGSRPSSRNRST